MASETLLLNRLFAGRIFILETMPPNEMIIIPSRREHEAFEDWAKRSVRVKNIGERDAAIERLLKP